MRLSPLLLLAPAVSAYSQQATDCLSSLAASVTSTNAYINHLEGCGYKNTTEAIAANAPVADGSACQSADTAISQRLASTVSQMQSCTSSLAASRSDSSTSSTSSQAVVASFSAFADAFYALFNAMDLAECTYILTPQSRCFPVQFTQTSGNNLVDAWNALVAELSKDLVVAAQIFGLNLKQQTHFAGTSFLATQVGDPELLALAACELITSIVESEGGGSS